jgi:glucose/arabinose dehydrogenase
MKFHLFSHLWLLRAVLAVLTLSSVRAAPVDTTNFSETSFVSSSNLAFPTGLAWAPDGSGRLFVICKGGQVRIVQHTKGSASGTVLADPWATFGTTDPATPNSIGTIITASECGLIGMCFDPGFVTNRYVYFFVTTSTSVQQIIRCTDDPVTNTGSNPTVIVNNLPTRGGTHNGGGLGIGQDGRLYWSIGDNNSTPNGGTNLTSLAAKVGRANRFTGAGLNDNPLWDGTSGVKDLIWARGFRNPFSLTFQPTSGKLWLNVVGSSVTSLTKGYEQAFIVPRGAHGGWSAYENSQPADSTFLSPAISYRIGPVLASTLTATGAVRNNGTVTFTTTDFQPLRKGAKVTIAGVTDTSFNGTFFVAARLSDTQFSVVQAGPNATSGGGTATTAYMGESITGGCFYDATAFPTAYRGNFFFGDYVSGLLFRTTLDGNDEPTSVDNFATGISSYIDSAVGPDGAIYSLRHLATGSVRRTATTSSQQNLVVQPTSLGVMEGGSAVFNVSLASAPVADVTVTISKTSGDEDLAISGASTLTFTPTNWNVYQSVVLAAAEDADRTCGSAAFQVSASGLSSYSVNAREVENDEPRLRLSKNLATVAEGASTTLTVSLMEAPATNVTVTAARTSGDGSVAVTGGASLTFTPANFATAQTVTIAALADADSVAGAAEISVAMAGDPDRIVDISTTDNGSASPVITSTPSLTVVANTLYQYNSAATGNPVPTFSLTTKPTGMTVDSSTGIVTWTPTTIGTYPVTLQASNGYGTAASQSFNIVVSADTPPQVSISQPQPGSTLSGTNAEFFGNGVDDLGAVKAEFFVDGVLAYTDPGDGGHFHLGGGHNLFDTTLWANGPHTLRMRVTDTAGQTSFAEVQVFFANGTNQWKSELFSPTEQANAAVSGPLADPDGDGLLNLLEYGLNLNPKASNPNGLPSAALHSVANVPYFGLTFTRVKWATDLTYHVEAASSPAGPWTLIDPLLPQNQLSVRDDTPSPGLQTITVRDALPASGSSRMMRLRVTK